ncbi:MAG: YdeI/OmpD-associated family protein [Acidobacteriota bacterium]|nr:YdeI/OmpD-associated family protein [Acidobacteriota bacterium]
MAATRTKTPAKSPAKLPAKGTERPQRFRVLLETQGGGEVTGFGVPFDVPKVFGTRARVPVRGTINGTPFRGSIVPMGGRHIMVVNRKLRAASGVRGGETVTVTMERDTEPRVVTPPEDFARAVKGNKDALATWQELSYTHQREFAEHVEDAKRPETRQRRIEKSIQLLAAGEKEPR